MGISKPYKRTARIFVDGSYKNSGKGEYILHQNYAESPANFIRAFLLIQQDVLELFNYVEPSDTNLNTYSHRIHELLLRTCVEVEANCKAILRENGYARSGNWNMVDYKKIEQSHYLSYYFVKIQNWQGNNSEHQPFAVWASGGSLDWYQAYNNTKHDRHLNFSEANFENLVAAICGLSTLIASQFLDNSFSGAGWVLGGNDTNDGFESGVSSNFRIKYPASIPVNERYEFESSDIDFNVNIFQCFNYT